MVEEHHIVQLDGSVKILPPSFPHKYTTYLSTKPSEVASRIQDATILIATGTRVPYDTLMDHAPKLQLIASLGVGYDNVNVQAVKERGMTLVNVPAQNTDSVTEHAFALYSAVKRNLVPLHAFVQRDGWENTGLALAQFKRAPRTNKEETMGIVGYGAIGKRCETMAKALGMQVLIAERKGASEARDGRVSFEEVLQKSTVVILTCPLDESTHNMVDEAELRTMREDAILVNVGRGGIVNEAALAAALREFRIGGAATDVFETEPVTKEHSPLLDSSIPNLVLSPHVAWFSSGTIKGTLAVTKQNLESFVAGNPQNVVVGPSKQT